MMVFFRLLAWAFMTAAIVLVAIGGAGYWVYSEAEAPGPAAEPQTIVIPAHSSIAVVAELLGEHNVIRRPLVFELIAKLTGRGIELKPGEYEFPAGSSTMQALNEARPFIRREVGERTDLRFVPQIEFVSDTSAARAARISQLLREATRDR